MRAKTRRKAVTSFEELAEALRRSTEKNTKMLPPHLRLWEIAGWVQKFLQAVLDANAPRSFYLGDEKNPKKHAAMRRHREAHLSIQHQELGLMPQLVRLTSVNCATVFGDHLGWGVNPHEWEANVWKPLNKWAWNGHKMLYSGMKDEKWPQFLDSSKYEEWWDEGEAIRETLLERMTELLPSVSYPKVDLERQVFTWREKEFQLGKKRDNKSYLLLVCLVKAKGKRVDSDTIFTELDYPSLKHGNSFERSKKQRDNRFRQDLRRLRVALKTAGEPELSKAVVVDGAGLRLDMSKLPSPAD